ncbi:MAG: hypothetical protein EPO40_21085 [Myxococcaceae bacterium]|nr:MAG: hypothetical protein EPO40_21085 [Myxococcaceae bacterium]
MSAPEGIYRTSALREPRAPRDPRVASGVALGVAAVLLALAALWIALTTGLLARPSAAALGPAIASSLCALKGAAVARRLWCSRQRAVAGVVAVLAVMALAGDALAAVDLLTHEDPPPLPAGGWTLWRC